MKTVKIKTENYAEKNYERFDDLYDLPAVIVEKCRDGSYSLIDGYHRLASAAALGVEEVAAVIATDEIMDKCSEFGSGEMEESEWIEWIENMGEKLV